jgi:ABC-type amino acid transport substrate-binding protein
MKYIILLLLLFNLLFSNNEDLTTEEKKWIKENEIIIGIEQWYPITYTNKNHQMDGLISDIFKIIIHKYNLKTKTTSDEWFKLLSQVQKGEIDVIPAVFHTKDREKKGLFTQTVHQTKDYLFVKDTSNTISSFNSLKNKKLAIVKDYGTIPKIKNKFPEITIVETKSLQESVNLVLNKKVDALFDAQIVVQQYLNNSLITGLKPISQSSFKPSDLYFYSNIKKPILQSILKKGLNSISKQQKMK